ncbi:MAG: hypothetical protein C0599_14315 [Salinivirgaceae bacterium]|nr:MAG: hypothetical protein C0599_14315 [Salinivirgaceae bacterium]
MRTITLFTLLLILFSSFSVSAQNAEKSNDLKNRVIITVDEDEPFSVFLNDKKMTPKPGTKHVFDNLDRQSFNLTIKFFKGAAPIKKKLMVKDGMIAEYKLKKAGANQYVFKLENEKAIPKLSGKDKMNLMGDPKEPAKDVKKDPIVSKNKNRVIIRTKEDEPFTVFLNGKKMTPKPGTKHVFTNLDRQSFNLEIKFFKGAAPITKKLMVKDGIEATYELKRVNPKQYVFKLVNENSLKEKDNGEATGNLMGGPTGDKNGGNGDKDKVDTPAPTYNNRVVIYNDTNEPFTVFLNGEKVTPKPGSKQILENLEKQSYNLKIDFYRNVKSINKKLMVKEGKEATYKLKKAKDGQYIFQLEKERTLPGSKDNKQNLMGPQGSKKKVISQKEAMPM